MLYTCYIFHHKPRKEKKGSNAKDADDVMYKVELNKNFTTTCFRAEVFAKSGFYIDD